MPGALAYLQTFDARGYVVSETHENYRSWPCLNDPPALVHDPEPSATICHVDGTQTLYR